MWLNKKGKKIGVLGFNPDNVSAILRRIRWMPAPTMRRADGQLSMADAASHHGGPQVAGQACGGVNAHENRRDRAVLHCSAVSRVTAAGSRGRGTVRAADASRARGVAGSARQWLQPSIDLHGSADLTAHQAAGGERSMKSRRFKMAVERTLSIIKPDAVAKNVIGEIYSRFEKAGLRVIAARMTQLSDAQAGAFYDVHRARPFFGDLVKFMTSGPVMVQVLQGEGAIAKNRELMGATDPKKADKGTIRADFADSIDANAVHGSDSAENAAIEVAFFFPGLEIHPR
jgi:nucleoside-diphosphate kinase